MRKKELITFFLFALIICIYILVQNVLADDSNDTMTVSANILGFHNQGSLEGVGIQVTDYIDLGNVTNKTLLSAEKKIYINNTGSVNITVTPQLEDPNEGIFSFLYFRLRMSSSDTSKNKYSRIGDFNIYIDKPSSGSKVKSEYCYMRLNLTEFDGPLTEDLYDHRANVIFYAMPA